MSEVFKVFEDLWDWVATVFSGKQIAILGQRGTGKTCWYNYLDKGRLPPTSQTITAEHRNRLKVEAGDGPVRIKSGFDLPGGQRTQWKQAYESADFVFYMIHAEKYRHDVEYQRQVREDGREIKDWKNDKADIYIVLTHVDADPDLPSFASRSEYAAELTDRDDFTALRHRLTQTGTEGKTLTSHILHGSLKSEDEAEKLLEQFRKTL